MRITSVLKAISPLKNFRRGFATNSSSSHSFVYLKKPAVTHANEGIPDGSFNWEDFRLDSIKEKLFYVLVGRIGGAWKTPTEEEVDEAIEANIEDFPEFTRDDFREAMVGSVDHESVGTIGIEQARDPYVVVFGGNDNSDGSQERAEAVRNGEIDWSKTDMGYQDADEVPVNDVEGLQKAQEIRKRGW